MDNKLIVPGEPQLPVQNQLEQWEDFFDFCMTETLAGLEESTRRVYANTYIEWLDWCEWRQIPCMYISRTNVTSFLTNLEVTIRSRERHLASLRSLLRTAGRIQANNGNWETLLRGFERYKVPTKGSTTSDRTKIALEPEQIYNAFAVWRESTEEHARNKAILGLAFGCGMRSSEIARLRWQHLYLDAGKQHVEIIGGKGRKDRTTPIYSRLALDALERWREACDQSRTFLFYGFRGKNARKDTGIAPSTIYRVFQVTGEAIGIPTLHPHDARRTFITQMIRKKQLSEADIADDVGHASTRTLKIYHEGLNIEAKHALVKLDY